MNDQNKTASVSPVWYLLGGLAVGAAAGILLAPKKGAETIEDIQQWRLRARAKARNAFARMSASLPGRVKAAAAAGALKGGAQEAFDETRDGAKHLIEG